MIEIGDKIYHTDYGVGKVEKMGDLSRHPKHGQAYLVRFQQRNHYSRVWCVFEDEITLIEKAMA